MKTHKSWTETNKRHFTYKLIATDLNQLSSSVSRSLRSLGKDCVMLCLLLWLFYSILFFIFKNYLFAFKFTLFNFSSCHLLAECFAQFSRIVDCFFLCVFLSFSLFCFRLLCLSNGSQCHTRAREMGGGRVRDFNCYIALKFKILNIIAID